MGGFSRLWLQHSMSLTEALGGFGKFWERLWEALEGFGMLGKAFRSFGRLWKAWEGFGRLWDALEGFGRLWQPL